ncbi:hypothetical protein [Clostridium pasteurianum]|uniref:Uncharacterized protein n=1 Tax=Clostridium pasteurianum BC1 TaxID=86416 RepID=R4K2Y4_CLOPA|nr:hypothetical protein [Clostridium pasteurianum]AGK96953.1 hypothetical protein Clopa_2069 [Clostridium pasteurianum BC1]
MDIRESLAYSKDLITEKLKNESDLSVMSLIIEDNHPRINKVVHKYDGTSKWEDILEKIIINHLKSDELLD